MADPSDVTNAIRGHKAAISNQNVSEEAKEHSRQVLKELEGQESTGSTSASSGGRQEQKSSSGGGSSGDNQHSVDGKDPGNVARGLKAAINNPNVSDEAKEAAKEKLQSLGQ